MTGNRASWGRPRRHAAWIAGIATVGLALAAFGGATAGAATATAPGAPTIGLATAGVESVSVAFTAPASDGGSRIFVYKVSCVSSNGGTARSSIGFRSPVSVRHLTAAKSYSCTVVAANRVGSSAPSAASNAVVTLSPPVVTAPGAPTIGLATAGVESVSVAFTAPASDGGSRIFVYKVSCVSSNGGTARSSIGFRSPVSVRHLTAAKSYSCTVVAANRVGSSAPSAASNVVVTLS